MKAFKNLMLSSLQLKKIKSGNFNFNKQNLLFCTLRNEKIRMPYFLQYYRNLGIEHFFFVDNDSSDGFIEYVEDMEDVTVYHTEHSYKNSNFGMDWLNYLLRKYGQNKWCVVCDPDEFLVYPNCETIKLSELTEYLDSQNQISLYCTMLDMYPKKSRDYIEGEDPLISCGYFDKSGYTFKENIELDSIWTQGGVRSRLFFKENMNSAPALNKYPLIKWDYDFCFLSSMHHGYPNAMNSSYRANTTGAILHFKFLSTFKEKVKEEMVRGEHYNSSGEYKHYHDNLDSLSFYNDQLSVKYINSQQLIDLDLMKNGKF